MPSNGHGEDVISLALIEALRQRRPELSVAVLPLVGTGEAFAAAEQRGLLRRVGPRRRLPSGGFSNQSLGGLLRDLAAGLPLLTAQQVQLVRRWGRGGAPVLAVEASDNSLDLWWKGRFTLEEYHERIKAVPQLEIARIEDAGHMMHHDQPEALAALIERFIA